MAVVSISNINDTILEQLGTEISGNGVDSLTSLLTRIVETK